MPAPSLPPTRLSRRALMGVGVGAAAVVPLTTWGRAGMASANSLPDGSDRNPGGER